MNCRKFFRKLKYTLFRIDPNALPRLTGNRFDTIMLRANEGDLIPDMSKHIKNATVSNYQKLEEMAPSKEHTEHHAKGTEAASKGEYVFEFRVAGSGNDQWRKVYKGFSGYNEKFDISKRPNPNAIPEGTYLDELKNKAKERYMMDPNRRYTDAEVSQAIEREYGRPLYRNHEGVIFLNPSDETKIMPGIRLKENGTKKVVNFSGPLGTVASSRKGVRNIGEYSIENLKTYMYQMADDWLNDIERKIARGEDNGKPINFNFSGHSRGGCAASEASTMVEHLVNTKYKNLKDRVKINVVLYDPVPGAGSYKHHKEIDQHNEKISLRSGREGKGLFSEEGDKERNSETVIYSIHSNHEKFFAPQRVLGASKVILTGTSHDINLFDVDNGHKRAYISAENGETYRGSGFSDLKDGIYVLDENKVMVQLKNRREAKLFFDSVFSDKKLLKSQRKRHESMARVVGDWFLHNKEEITPKDTRYAIEEAIREDVGALRYYIESTKAGNTLADPEGMKKRVMASLFSHCILYSRCNSDPNMISDKAFEAYKKAAKSNEGLSIVENDAHFKEYIKTVDTAKLEKMLSGDIAQNIRSEFKEFKATLTPKEIEERNKIVSSWEILQ